MGTTTTPNKQTQSANRYTIRPYDESDRNGILDLDEVVWKRQRSSEWFAWKYERNPYLTETPVYIATRDGEIVGARPLLAFQLSVNGTEVLALQPSDTMVHPDHRGNGLFTRMTQRAIDTYADRDPVFFFNFPNQQAQPGYRKLGWRDAGNRITYYRIQNPEPFLAAHVDTPLGHALGRMAEPALTAYNRLHDWYTSSSANVSVKFTRSVPAELLASLYRQRVPDRIHAVRDERFYRWRFASPPWTRRTYVAVCDEEPVAALLARTRTNADGVTLTQMADVVPLEGDRRWLTAVGTLVDRVLADHQDSDVVAVPESPLPHSFLRQRGFHRNDRLPMSYLKSYDRVIAVRPLTGDGPQSWQVSGRSLIEKANWLVTFAERDTA